MPAFLRKAPQFWWQGPQSVYALALAPFGMIYGRRTLARMAQPVIFKARLPVICIGNFVAGGTGKTPFCITLAGLIKKAGRHPVFLTRGYRGRCRGPVRVSPGHHSAEDVGDEALLLARHHPTIVARDRGAGSALAAACGDIVIMDDGMQNGTIAKDYTIALVDGRTGFGNMHCIPAGPLRAPPLQQLPFVDHLAIIGKCATGPDDMHQAVRMAARAGLPFCRARLVPRHIATFLGLRLMAYCGIGRPQKFFDTLQTGGAALADTRIFPDHHMFSPGEARQLLARAFMLDARLVSTEKDHIRMEYAKHPSIKNLYNKTLTFSVNMKIDDGTRLISQILDRIKKRRI